MKLNLACGANKIEGYVNVDIEESCKPDLILDFTKLPLPFETGGVDTILLFHAIEHIQKKLHGPLLAEFHRILKPEGNIIISYPEFEKCFDNWKNNYKGHRAFWENTIFGLQRYPSDYHVCIMQSEPEFSDLLKEVGFKDIKFMCEPTKEFNTVCRAVKGVPMPSYEDVLKKEIFG